MMPDWDPLQERPKLTEAIADGVSLRAGDRVRICPKGRADILDIALEGKTATIESIEQDYEDRIYLALTVDDDPGRDFGLQRKPGHRFFYGIEEVEPLGPDPLGPNPIVPNPIDTTPRSTA